MYVKEVTVENQVGLHARPATFFIQKANEFKSSIWVEKEERRVNAKSLLGVLSLGIVGGTTIRIIADGADEQAAVDGLIKLVDVAPEEPGNLDFIRECHNEVRISIAHTCTDYDTAVKAFEAGATHMTHLYNAMPGITHRAPGPIIAAMEHDAEVELITDNVHIHPAMVRFTFNTFGNDHVILIADSMMACGLPDGQYSLGGQAVTVSGPRATLTEHPDTIAGSATCLYDCMRRAVCEMGVPLESAVRAATENPARSIGVDADYGSLAAGRYGNVVLADDDLNILAVVQKGKVIHDNR